MAGPELRRHIVLCGWSRWACARSRSSTGSESASSSWPTTSQARHREVAARLGVQVIDGSPRDPECLRDADVEHARAIVLTEDDDTVNIHAALLAESLNHGIHVVLRIFDDEFARRVESLFPDAVAMSSSALAAPGFITAMLDQDADERWIDVLGRTLALRYADVD